jgi:hypothetical protein
MVYIYVLELENDKYYIGKTNYPNIRINKHFNNNGSQWTSKYKPIKVIEILANLDDFDEDKITLQYMKSKGIDNVRGGSFVTLNLDENTIKFIERMLNNSTNKCFKCGGDHFIKDCDFDELIDFFGKLDIKDLSNSNSILRSQTLDKNNIKCDRCYRIGHCIDNCYAKTYIKDLKCYKFKT